MRYNAPPGSQDPNAPYVNGIPGVQKGSPVNANAVEYPQREIINVIEAAGLTPTNAELDQLLRAIGLIVKSLLPDVPESPEIYEVGEFYYFRHPTLKANFAPSYGAKISAVHGRNITEYPIWDYLLHSAEGQLLCKTEAEWLAMNTAVWHTNADGTKIGWDGIGGVPFYAIDAGNGTLRLPDIRGMYVEAAGFDDPLDVGGRHGDMVRNIYGRTGLEYGVNPSGPFANTSYATNNQVLNAGSYLSLVFDASTAVPTGNANKPRAWGALPCVYLGAPR